MNFYKIFSKLKILKVVLKEWLHKFLLITQKNIQHYTEKRKTFWQTLFKWFSIIWLTYKMKFRLNGCAHLKDIMKMLKMIKILKPQDLVWELSTDLFTQLVNNKLCLFFLKQSKLYLLNQIGDTNIQLLWHYRKSDNILMNRKKFHLFYKWLLDLWEIQMPC